MAYLRLLAALWVIGGIIYTPIHLALESHSDCSEVTHGLGAAAATALTPHDDHNHDDHHECHAAAQHPSHLAMAVRIDVIQLVAVLAPAWIDLHVEDPQPQRVQFSGLSPPPHARCWQFLVRAALPARDPTLRS